MITFVELFELRRDFSKSATTKQENLIQMRNSKLRSFVWTLLIAFSFASYTYLNCFTSDLQENYGVNQNVEAEYKEEKKDSKLFLPDLALVKKLLNITKIVLPGE